MKIVILSSWFSERMGYIENCLSKSLAKQGHEVHVVSSTAQVYYNHPDYKKIYEPFLGKNIQEEGVRLLDGYKLHRLPFYNLNNKIIFKNLGRTLKNINPDIVQVFDASSYTTLQAAWYKIIFGYTLFTANHTVASVFPLFQKGTNSIVHRIFFWFTRTIPGKLINHVTKKCYPPTVDARDIAIKYYGVSPEKTKLAPLGVDTDFFKPMLSAEDRKDKRNKLGFSENDIVCIYTGRFTDGKNPLCLAKAINRLNESGMAFKGLFMGDGPQWNEIKNQNGCTIHKFVPYHELPEYYGIADIGVWPKQESTSMIDAAACGLPIIISNKVLAKERVDGNGLTYEENNVDSLIEALLQLEDPALRKQLSDIGIRKMQTHYSWDKIARERIEDYRTI
ncbi:MAG TPA: glycosyltransferase family 4 protein [Bacteroidia bacterium]|nr:glycosyltransferase family 4 protein [Bacteroidia bacterium]